MIKILMDTAIIVALITFFGVIVSSVFAPIILKYYDACNEIKEENING